MARDGIFPHPSSPFERKEKIEVTNSFELRGNTRIPIKKHLRNGILPNHRLEVLEHDTRALAFEELDLSQVRLENFKSEEGGSTDGFTRLERLRSRADLIPLEHHAFLSLWLEEDIPLSWKEREHGVIKKIFFDGCRLRSEFNFDCTLYLEWTPHGLAAMAYPLYMPRHEWDYSAVLPLSL